MGIYRVDWRDGIPEACQGGVAAIGNFDGLHLGHQALLARLRERARASGGPAVAVTFDPHPLELLRPEAFQPILTTLDDRAGLMLRHGSDGVIILRTDRELLDLPAENFFQRVILGQLRARGLVEGPNFGFGRRREGTVATLRTFCAAAGLGLEILEPRQEGGVLVSSSRVRDVLVAGDVAAARGLLGRPYHLRGTVGAGQRRGRTLGFPTANLEKVPTLLPGDGVYAVRAWVGDTAWPAAANVGPNPTFAEQQRKLEVHLIGYAGDLYGQELRVDFLAHLRATRPFAGVAELAAQLREDVAAAERVGRAEGAGAQPPSS